MIDALNQLCTPGIDCTMMWTCIGVWGVCLTGMVGCTVWFWRATR